MAWEPPSGAAAAIAAHLVNASEIARRTGVSRAAVSMWFARHPSLSRLAVGEIGDNVFVFWWPQVEAELHALGLPAPSRNGYRGRKSNPSNEEQSP